MIFFWDEEYDIWNKKILKCLNEWHVQHYRSLPNWKYSNGKYTKKLKKEEKPQKTCAKLTCGTILKCFSTCVMKDPEERGKGTEMIMEGIMAKNFPNLLKTIKPYI